MKYFLTCEHCGHNNEVTSEYLTFCESCSKKLVLNFRDWQKKHRDATLSDYMEKVCINEISIDQVNTVAEASKKDPWRHWIGISQTLSVIIGVGLFLLPIILSITSLNYTLEASTYTRHTLDYTWHEETYGSFGLHINSPITIEKTDLTLPSDAASFIDVFESYVGGSENDPLMIMLNSIKYQPGVELNLDKAAFETMNGMKVAPGITNFVYQKENVLISGLDGFEQFGSYDKMGVRKSFVNVGSKKDLVAWQIIIVYDDTISGMRELVEKVVRSIDFLYDSSI